MRKPRFQKIQEGILSAVASATADVRFISLGILLAQFVSMLNGGETVVRKKGGPPSVAVRGSSAPRRTALNISRLCQKRPRREQAYVDGNITTESAVRLSVRLSVRSSVALAQSLRVSWVSGHHQKLKCIHCAHLTLRKISKIGATRCQLLRP